METAAVRSAAIFHHADPTTVRSVVGRRFLQPYDGVRDTMNRFVQRISCEVIEQEHRCTLLSEVVLEPKDLTPVPQRALRQEADLGQAV